MIVLISNLCLVISESRAIGFPINLLDPANLYKSVTILLMNTQKGFASMLIIALVLVVLAGGYYFYAQNNGTGVAEHAQDFDIRGTWKFAEASTSAWNYTLSIDAENETRGTLHIDGNQTLVRMNVTVEKLNDSANISLDSYGEGNQVEVYAKGDGLMTVSPATDRNVMFINWYAMQPNIEASKTNAFFVRQEEAPFSVSGNNLLVIKEGKTIQTLTLTEDALPVFLADNPYMYEQRFITDQDVNFDGYADAALLTGAGYGGVNMFYDYYIFNPSTSKLEKSDTLVQISNPDINISTKTITSSSRSGPQWYAQTFQWNGSSYVVSEVVAQEAL